MYPLPAHTGRRGQGERDAGGSVPACTPSAQMGKGGTVACPTRSPRIRGGAAKGEGRGRGSRAPFPHERGGAKRQGGQCGQVKREAEGDRERRRALMRPSARMGKGGGRRVGPGGRGAAGIVRPLSVCEGGGGGQCGERKGGRGRRLALLQPLFDANGVGEGVGRRGGERSGKGRSRPCGGSNTCLPQSGVQRPSPPSLLPPIPAHLRRKEDASRAALFARRPGKEAHEGMPPPPLPLPYPLFAPPHLRRRRTVTSVTFPSPFPIRVEGVHAGMPPPASLSPWPRRPVRAGRGYTGARHPHHPSPFTRMGGCTRARRLVRTGRGAQGQAMLASPRVAQQGRRSLRAPAFTAPAPHIRAPYYDLDKKIDVD
ncbi:hypothetical protein EDB83DRAFT_2324743 [Lactarius deliciosus]|nr:hypothetical protein EDB83DRAFT_2324743 [Lactarius deliciosus]